jgi:hypothetical protein
MGRRWRRADDSEDASGVSMRHLYASEGLRLCRWDGPVRDVFEYCSEIDAGVPQCVECWARWFALEARLKGAAG